MAFSSSLHQKDFATGALAGADLEQALGSEGGSSWLVGKKSDKPALRLSRVL